MLDRLRGHSHPRTTKASPSSQSEAHTPGLQRWWEKPLCPSSFDMCYGRKLAKNTQVPLLLPYHQAADKAKWGEEKPHTAGLSECRKINHCFFFFLKKKKTFTKVFFISHIQWVYSWHFQNSNLMWIWNSMKHIGRHLSEKIKVLAICYWCMNLNIWKVI